MKPRLIKKIQSAAIPFAECPAKTWTDDTGEVRVGRTASDHMKIVGCVARSLLMRVACVSTNRLFPKESALVAAVHDLGKVSPTFTKKLLSFTGTQLTLHPELQHIDPAIERQWGGHAGLSYLELKYGTDNIPEHIAEIAGRHHGYLPPSSIEATQPTAECYGGNEWHRERQALLKELKAYFDEDFPQIDDLDQAQLLAGLTTVADWIGSSSWFEDPNNDDWLPVIETALDHAGFIKPEVNKGLSFGAVFGEQFQPYESQQRLIDAVTGPGVYVLEVTMGEGKTEASLYAAYKMLEQGLANGIYFALPTQLTSNKLYERFNPFLNAILCGDSAHNALLVHSGAYLVETEIGEEARPGYSWFNSNKRNLLAPFAVGTIDQALLSVMNVKHSFVRSFGLAGKVVILDEVHTYDAYTGVLIDELVRHLQALGCTIIILSATLNKERREKMLRQPLQHNAYPLVTAVTATGNCQELPVNPEPEKTVKLKLCRDTREALSEATARAQAGQQVLWIENTVQDAQQRYETFCAETSDYEIGLLHSRFTPADRERNETHWVNAFGKAGQEARKLTGRILVGTQVLEQSLDIDADFLVTQFAPTDMLLQRFGRLWRHQQTPRVASAVHEAWIIAPPTLHSAINNPDTAFQLSAVVYRPYVLCRSLEVWDQLTQVQIPSDLRTLIEATYCHREESGQMKILEQELLTGTRNRVGQHTLEHMARLSINLKGGEQADDDRPATRYSDQKTIDLLLIKDLSANDITFLDGNRTEFSRLKNKKARRELARQLARFTVNAPRSLDLNKQKLKGLANNPLRQFAWFGSYDAPDAEAALYIAKVSNDGTLNDINNQPISQNKSVHYDGTMGLMARD